MPARVPSSSSSDLAFLNEPYRPFYSPFAVKPVFVHQYVLSLHKVARLTTTPKDETPTPPIPTSLPPAPS
jgi:hypothetical protein